jgi:hypothetical protein
MHVPSDRRIVLVRELKSLVHKLTFEIKILS